MAVMMILKARAPLRRSVQLVRVVDERNWKESGKMDGNPIEVRPFALNGR